MGIVTKLVASLVMVFIIQQISHELGHAIMCIALGGKVLSFYVGLNFGHVMCNVSNIPLFITIQRLSGGFFAGIILFIIYRKAHKFWWEFRSIALTLLFLNITIACVEGFLFDFYVANLDKWDYVAFPWFIISVYLVLFRARKHTVI